MIEDNAPSKYRKQHGQTLLMCDLALAEKIIEDDQHKDMMFYIQMRDAFNSKSEGRDSMLGRLVDGDSGGSEPSSYSLCDKYMSFLREFDKVHQAMLSIMALPEKPNGRLKHLHGMWNMKTEIRDTIDAFSAWCRK
jgi:hypothetical protein